MNPKKLSPSKINPRKLLGGSSFAKKTTNISEKLKEDSITVSKNNLNIIKGQVFEIKNLVTNLTTLKKNKLKTQRTETEKQKFGEREKELEKKKKPEDNKIKLPQAPKLGFLDIVKRFVVNTLIGFVVVRLIKHLPKLIEVAKFVGGAMDFITNVGGKLLNGLATFVQKGYEAYDFTRNTLKSFGGDNALKLFDGFNDALGGIVTAALAASFAIFDMAGGDSRDAPGRGGGRPAGGGYKYDSKRALIRKKYGDSAAKIYDLEKAKGKNTKQITDIIENRYIKKGRIIPQRMTGSLGGTDVGSKVLGRGIQRAPQRLAIKGLTATLGKGGAKTVLKFVKPLVNKIPIIGGLIEFGLSWALGEPVGKAAFRGIGSILLGGIGTAIGGPIGAFIGAAAGGEVGGALYDMFFGNKKPSKQKVAKAAGGGQPATRGGKLVGGAPKRTAPKSKAKRQISIQSTQLKPGANIGGKKNIENVFPKSKDKNQVSPLDYIEKSYKNTAQDRLFGPLLNLQTKSLVGQKPGKVDYTNAAQGLSNWMTMTFSDEILRTGAVYAAGGGEINADMLSKKSGDMTDAIAKSLEDSISKRMDDNIQDLMKQMGLKPVGREEMIEKNIKESQGDEDIEGGGGLTTGKWGPMLDLISSGEGGYESVNPSLRRPQILDMNLNQLLEFKRVSKQRDGGSAALGRYQFINPQLAYQLAGLDPSEKFTPANQDKMAVAYLEKKRRGKEWIQGKITTREYIEDLAREWGAFRSYSGYVLPGNSGKIGPEKIEAALNKVKKGGYSPQEISGLNLPATSRAQSLSRGSITSYFGSKESFRKKGHEGVDIGLNQGTPLSFKMKGSVLNSFKTSSTDREAGGGYGSYMDVKLENGTILRLAHLSKIFPGSRFGPGNVIALSGGQPGAPGSGRSGGPHLHLEQHSAKLGTEETLKGKLDPVKYGGFGLVQTGGIISRFHGGIIPKDGKYNLHKGEFVIDPDSTKNFGKSFLATINSIENQTQLKQKVGSLIGYLSHIAGYELGGQQEIEVEPQIVYVESQKGIPVPVGGGGYSGSGSGEDYSQELSRIG
jgi:murein DD-endopeptidase MepM/ murein hydrolase activator NlpD